MYVVMVSRSWSGSYESAYMACAADTLDGAATQALGMSRHRSVTGVYVRHPDGAVSGCVVRKIEPGACVTRSNGY